MHVVGVNHECAAHTRDEKDYFLGMSHLLVVYAILQLMLCSDQRLQYGDVIEMIMVH